jgi:hypothetical protein
MPRLALLPLALLLAACSPERPVPPPTPPPADTASVGASGHVRRWSGDLPIVLSVPHDGWLAPAGIPDRTGGVTVRDSHARALAEAIREALRAKFGRAPHLIVCELSRRKVDGNRPLPEGATDPAAVATWRDYHDSIEQAERAVLARWGRGLYLDIHSHGHPEPRIEIGYLLTPADLSLGDAELSAAPGIAARSSIRGLAGRTTAGFAELVRGPTSLGGLLSARGVAAIPGPGQALRAREPFFSGAYDIAAHGSREPGHLDAAQLEVPHPMRDTPEHRAATAQALADALGTYFERHFGLRLAEGTPGR